MSVTIFFLAIVGAIAGWWLSHQRLTAKPWLEAGAIDDFPATGASLQPAAKIGLGVFLAVVGSLFALLISAYLMRMNMASMEQGDINLGDWRPLPVPKLLWLNTGVLIASSAALQWAWVSARRRETGRLRAGLYLGGLCALVFLGGQLLAWRQLSAAGYFLSADATAAFFYLLTGVHGLHVLGGLVALGRTITKSWRGIGVEKLRLSVQLCAIYWHFLLLVWIILFGLLWLGASNLLCRTVS
jgi:cytochrome c oxidase subunit 3